MHFKKPIRWLAALCFLSTAPHSAIAAGAAIDSVPASRSSLFEAVRQADLRFASMAYWLATANAELCDRLEPATGMVLHTLDQYDRSVQEGVAAHFGFTSNVGIEAVIADSPADLAGLQADDMLISFGPIHIDRIKGKDGTTRRLINVQRAIAALPATEPVNIGFMRDGGLHTARIKPLPACKSRFELVFGNGYDALADGEMVQISWHYFETYPEEQVAAAVAHEFAHNILRHRERLEAQKVSWGLLSGFGGNVKYFRQSEVEADLLSLLLLRNAGYDPQQAVSFWSRFGPEELGGPLLSRTHPKWRDRIATIEQELRAMNGDGASKIDDILMRRNEPMDGNWQSLLVRH